ncbi:MAG: hypothetical protein JXN60_06760, partial [Lentisphaerae bacterium]|nr:hypothetical protein [Lentisphaerota bacterium]
MPPGRFRQELERIGRMITFWRAELVFTVCVSIILSALWAFSLSDIFIRFERPGRIIAWLVLVALAGVAVFRILKALGEKHTVMGVAARVELSFPQLDNHLINFLQFAEDQSGNPFKKEYLRRGVPEFSAIDLRAMRDRKAHKRTNICLALAVMLMFIPTLFEGKAWAVAVWRVVNPFSSVQPISFTRTLKVEPGDATALIGSPLALTCRVQGKEGHKVNLDLKPADDDETIYAIGTVTGRDSDEFSYRIAKVTTDIKYRFRAGDASPSKWHNIRARAPLALSSIHLSVRPPDYTGMRQQDIEGISEEVFIPFGSEVSLKIRSNSELKSATLVCDGKEPVAFKRVGKENTWVGSTTVETGNKFMIDAVSVHDEQLTSAVNYTLVADKPPMIDILAPKGSTFLPPGTFPNVEFAVVDDYGITDVTIERIVAGSAAQSKEDPIMSWHVGGAKDFMQTWEGRDVGINNGTMMFRINARDNCPYTNQIGRSVLATFNAVDTGKAEKIQESLNKKADIALSRVVGLQKENITKTRQYEKSPDLANAQMWKELADTQTEIRELTKALLANPLKPLGNLAASVKKIYMNEMLLVISDLERVPNANESEKPKAVSNALICEEKILRHLTYAETASDQVKVGQKTSMLNNLLDAIIRGQTDVVNKTKEHVKSKDKVSSALVDKQDNIASDLSEFIRACNTQAGMIQDNDPNLADAYEKAAASCTENKI